jgi:branched-chain amino acid transport system permease protein
MSVSMTARKIILAAVLIALALPPLIGVNGYALQVMNLAFIYSIAALGLTIATGITGQIVLGQAALMGFGAYSTALLMTKLQAPFWIALPFGLLLTALVGVAIGRISVRIKGHYLAITTLALNEIFRLVVLNEEWLTGGPLGLRDIPTVRIPWLGANASQQLYLPLLAIALLAYAVTLRIYKNRLGRDMRAIRDDDLAAESMGVNSHATRTTAFVICSIWAALAGGLYVLVFGFISPNNFLVFESVRLLLMVVIGGLGSIGGTFIGAITVVGLPEALRGIQTYYFAAFGLGVVVILLVAPRGLGIIADWLLAPWLPGASSRSTESPAESAALTVEEDEARALAVAEERRKEREAAGPAPRPIGMMPLARIERVSKAFGGVTALNDVSFDIRQGEILGLIGPNGSGKSTLINACSGIVKISSGKILLGDRDIAKLPAWDVHAAGVSRIFQNVRVWDSMTVLENTMVPHPMQRAVSTLSALTAGAQSRLAEEEGRSAAYGALELVGIRHLADRKASDLSFGQSRLVEIARAVINKPKLLLLDEPGAGLRGGLILELAEILRRLRDEGMTILIVEHRVKLVVSLCDRIVVLNLGDKIAEGAAQDVARDKTVIDAYLGGRVERRKRPSRSPVPQLTTEPSPLSMSSKQG